MPHDVLRFDDRASLPEYIITYFSPALATIFARHTRLSKLFGLFLVLSWLSRRRSRHFSCAFRWLYSLSCSSLNISSDQDELFSFMLDWLAEQRTLRLDRNIMATVIGSHSRRGNALGSTAQSQMWWLPGNKRLEYEPSRGSQILMFNGRLFLCRKTLDDSVYKGTHESKETIILTCLGRSSKPLEALVEDVYTKQIARYCDKVIVWFASKDYWYRAPSKSRRTIDSVVLPMHSKARIVSDVENYLHPETRSFYKARSIPYRRGYLFHEAPGTGKTSLALALASHFSLDLYMLSLSDAQMSDVSLLDLMTHLGRKSSIILLEDIDSAGLDRRVKAEGRAPKPVSSLVHPEVKENKSQVTLSGLLNAIDGVAAPEGHILILTTNHPELLDPALVRSGRISVKIEFTSATNAQTRDLFLRYYQEPDSAERGAPIIRTTCSIQGNELQTMAEVFAAELSGKWFSPADVQDYLLMHQNDPQGALSSVNEYAATILEGREQLAKLEGQKKDTAEEMKDTVEETTDTVEETTETAEEKTDTAEGKEAEEAKVIC